MLDLPRILASVQLPAISCPTHGEPTGAEVIRSPSRSMSWILLRPLADLCAGLQRELNRALSGCLSTPHGKRIIVI
ncbi:hypothetical protein [Bradyrhizobium sp. USDA 3364]